MLRWQDKYDGPYVNHPCCTFHVNAEFIATENYGDEEEAPMTTVNIKTIRHIKNAEKGDSNVRRYSRIMAGTTSR